MIRYILWMLIPLLLEAGSIAVTDSETTAISDNTCFTRPLVINSTSAITDVNIEINIDHTWRADLDIDLTSPSGTKIDLTSDNGGSKNNLYVIFKDSAATSITNDNQNHSSVVERKPEQALSAFNGENPNGTWTLHICDDAGGDTGQYNYSTLTIFNADPKTPPIVQDMPLQYATLDTPYTFDTSVYVSETDGDPILSYRLDGTLPTGLSFDTSTGVISGTPTAEETKTVTLYATDTDGESDGKSFTIKVFPKVPAVEYRMDECYWLDGANGVVEDVKDSTPFAHHATSSNSAAISTSGLIGYAGHFIADSDLVQTEDSSTGNTNGALTVDFWVKLDQQMGKYAVVLTKSRAYYWDDGWGFVNPNNSAGDTLRFYINSFTGTHIDTTLSTTDGWTHFVGTYDGNVLHLYKNGVEVSGSPVSDNSGINNSADPIRMGFDNTNDATLKGMLDEVKVWNVALGDQDISDMYNNESNGKNYDGSTREAVVCGANVSANSWTIVGIPAELRKSTVSVSDIFEDDLGSTYGTDWVIYRRDYSSTDNNSSYTKLALSDTLEFGKGYWLGSKISGSWSENNIEAVDYNASNAACTAAQCVEIDLRSVTHDFETDGDDGTGPYRYNMSGFIGHTPVDWADCRFVIDGTVYTPSDAEAAGYAAKQIWQYNPGNGDANSNGYTTCDDTTPGGCKLEPYKGFWVQLKGPTKGKSVKLLIPKE